MFGVEECCNPLSQRLKTAKIEKNHIQNRHKTKYKLNSKKIYQKETKLQKIVGKKDHVIVRLDD